MLAPPSSPAGPSLVGTPPEDAEEWADRNRLGVLFAQLSAARRKGESTAGGAAAAEFQDLLTRLPFEPNDAVRGLGVVLDGHLAALEASRGNLHEAAFRLARGADSTADSSGYPLARTDCAGQLALIEAFRGDLGRARQHVAVVLEEASGPETVGFAHALLATAWLHLEQGENARAHQALDQLPPAVPGSGEPWLVTAQLLAEARLLTAEGRPETALRLLAPVMKVAVANGDDEWLTDLLTIASAEAFVAAGEPHRALALLTPVPARTGAEAGVLAATARRDIGDSRGARAALASVTADLAAAPLGVQVQSWLLEARLAHAEGHDDRARLLVSRALRAASEEGLRRPLATDRVWLRAFLEREPSLKREHHAFLSSLAPSVPAPAPEPAKRGDSHGWGEILLEPLTGRELEVLELLAQMYATEEIAGQLHLSVNTIKTHIKGVFRKLCVNRRTAAVRRGRELGLC